MIILKSQGIYFLFAQMFNLIVFKKKKKDIKNVQNITKNGYCLSFDFKVYLHKYYQNLLNHTINSI